MPSRELNDIKTLYACMLCNHAVLRSAGAVVGIPLSSELLQLKTQYMLMYTGSVQGSVAKTKAFMKQHADLVATRTRSGYNPILEDFSNTSFYIGSAGQCTAVHAFYLETFVIEGDNISLRLAGENAMHKLQQTQMCCLHRILKMLCACTGSCSQY